MTTIYQSFVTSLKEESHHVIVVQDSANALGRSLTLGTAICHELQERDRVPMILCSETPSRVRSHSTPVVIKSVEQVHGLLDNAEVLFLHSLTPLLINASTRQIVRLFRKKSNSLCFRKEKYFIYCFYRTCQGKEQKTCGYNPRRLP